MIYVLLGWHGKEEMYSRRIFFAKTEQSLFRFTCVWRGYYYKTMVVVQKILQKTFRLIKTFLVYMN